MFPNPTADYLICEVENTKILEIILYDLNGKKCFELNNINESKVSINIQHLDRSVYISKIITTEGTIERKIVKE